MIELVKKHWYMGTQKIILATTDWSNVSADEGKAREQELREPAPAGPEERSY
jgi:hypothetical protein